MNENPNLVFVYDGNATVFELTAKALHACQGKEECDINEEHKNLIKLLPYQIEFFHGGDFFLRFPETAGTRLPAIFIRHAHGLQRLMDSGELNHISTLGELKDKILVKLSTV